MNKITKADIEQSNLDPMGSMNILMQIMGSINDEEVQYDNYMPRRNRVATETSAPKELIQQAKDTIERLKIGQQLLQDWIDGKVEHVYYWDLDKLSE